MPYPTSFDIPSNPLNPDIRPSLSDSTRTTLSQIEYQALYLFDILQHSDSAACHELSAAIDQLRISAGNLRNTDNPQSVCLAVRVKLMIRSIASHPPIDDRASTSLLLIHPTYTPLHPLPLQLLPCRALSNPVGLIRIPPKQKTFLKGVDLPIWT